MSNLIQELMKKSNVLYKYSEFNFSILQQLHYNVIMNDCSLTIRRRSRTKKMRLGSVRKKKDTDCRTSPHR